MEEVKHWLNRYNDLINMEGAMDPFRMRDLKEARKHVEFFVGKGLIKKDSVNLMESHLFSNLTPEGKAYQTALGSPALVHRFPDKYPADWLDQVPLKVEILTSVKIDLKNWALKKGNWFYVWVNSFGQVSAILPDHNQVILKSNEFKVIEWHEEI